MALPLSPRSSKAFEGASDGSFVFAFDSLPPELLAACLAQLPLDSRARASCVARAWRAAARAVETRSRWLDLDLSAAATAEWRSPLSRRVVAALLHNAAALSGARSLDLSGQAAALDSGVTCSWLYDLLADEAKHSSLASCAAATRVARSSLVAVVAPACALWPTTAAALCGVLPNLEALTVAVVAAGGETEESLLASMATPSLRASAFTLSARLVLCPPPRSLAAALAPQVRWLKALDLSASGLADGHVHALAPALAGARALERLDLSENALSADCMAALVAALLPREGGVLQTLDLSGNAMLVRRGLGSDPYAPCAQLLSALTQQHEHELQCGTSTLHDGVQRLHPLRRLVVQCCAPLRALQAIKDAARSTEVAFGFGSHAWRLWGAV